MLNLLDRAKHHVSLVYSTRAIDGVRDLLRSRAIDDGKLNDANVNEVIGPDGRMRSGKLGFLQFRQKGHDELYPLDVDRDLPGLAVIQM